MAEICQARFRPAQDLTISRATVSSIAVLQDLAAATYHQTHWELPDELLDAHIGQAFSFQALAKDLQDSKVAILLAETESVLVGYLKIVMVPQAAYLERIYILEEFQGCGFGERLLEAGIAEAKSRGSERIWLRVWMRNRRAIDFCERNGFRIDGIAPIEDANFLMTREIGEPALAMLTRR